MSHRTYLEQTMAAGLVLLFVLVIAAAAPFYGRDSRSLHPQLPVNFPG